MNEQHSARPTDEHLDPRLALSKLFMEMLPAQVLAAGITKACGKLSTSNPEMAQRILLNSWRKVAPLLRDAIVKEPVGSVTASALLIEAYFVHSGDWKAMESEMVKDSGLDPALVSRAVEKLCAGLEAATEVTP